MSRKKPLPDTTVPPNKVLKAPLPISMKQVEGLDGGVKTVAAYLVENPYSLEYGQSGWVMRTTAEGDPAVWNGQMDSTTRSVSIHELGQTLVVAEELHEIGAVRRPN